MQTDLGNLITLENGKLTVQSKKYDGVHYAFYLYYPGGKETKHYIRKRTHTFEKEILDGFYKICFYRRDINGEKRKVQRNDELFIVKDGKILEEKVLVENESYKIGLYDNGSEITFITFGAFDVSKNSRPFGLKYLYEKGYNVIGCYRNSDQYQSLSLEDFYSVVAPYIQRKKVFVYGSSLGAYAAVYYGGIVNGTIIAAAPKNSAHPLLIQHHRDSIYQVEDFKHVDISKTPLTNNPVYIILDPHIRTDKFFLNELIKPAYPHAHVLEVNYAGHEVLYHINRVKKLDALITMIVNGQVATVDNLGLLAIDTEFTLFGKAVNAYRYFISYMEKLETIDGKHPALKKKLEDFKKNLQLREIG